MHKLFNFVQKKKINLSIDTKKIKDHLAKYKCHSRKYCNCKCSKYLTTTHEQH